MKVLYVLLIRVLQWATGKLILATVLPSVIGYLGIGVLVWYAVGCRSALLAATLICYVGLTQLIKSWMLRKNWI